MNSTSTRDGRQNLNFDLTILEHAPYGIVACDIAGEILFANPLAAFMLQEKSLPGKNLLRIMADIPEFKKGWDMLQTEFNDQFALPFSIKPDPANSANNLDTETSLALRVTRFQNNPDQRCNTLIFIEDLSSNETLDVADRFYTDSLENLMSEKCQELELMQEQLIITEKKAAMIETAGAVAHELRQPMTTIIGTIDLLNTKPEVQENPDIKKRFEIIQKQCLRMAETIKQMEELVEYRTRQYLKNKLIVDLEESSRKQELGKKSTEIEPGADEQKAKADKFLRMRKPLK